MSSDTLAQTDAEMKGWLFKWTNYLKGYQRRWFILSKEGFLSYSRNQAEMAHTCRGMIRLHGAMIHTEDSCTFVISNGGTQTFHIKAANEVERQRWVTALELAKAKAIRAIESEDEDFDASQKKYEMANVMKALAGRLEDLQTCSDLISKHGLALIRSLIELESVDLGQDTKTRMKTINERATHFRIICITMTNKCSEFMEVAQNLSNKCQRFLQHETDQRLKLEEMVEQLAMHNSVLEQACQSSGLVRPGCSPSDDDEENAVFYDAQNEETLLNNADFILKIPSNIRKASTPRIKHQGNFDRSDEASASSSDVEDTGEKQIIIISSGSTAPNREKQQLDEHTSKETGESSTSVAVAECDSDIRVDAILAPTASGTRRTRVPDKPSHPLSLWNIMKNCIGKELSKIPMPVNFSEPLSMLQRLTEDFEYADVLDRAAICKDSCEQLAYVAAFTVSSYSTTANRTGKPFNPLLGETFECDRTADLGWKAISEQVSHHPPMVAQHCEGKKWTCWQEFTMSSKFRGKYLQVVPLGTAHLEFNESGNHYTWRKVTTSVHNIIVGKLWVDQHGDMDIINHKDGSKCHLSFIPYSYFTRDIQRKVKGCVMDQDDKVKWIINGTWDGKIEIAPVISTEGTVDNPVYKTGPYTLAWSRRDPPEDCENYYNFTILACQLNEMEEGVAPTDSRNRPDQRLMEEGHWVEANNVKVQLEEKQRTAWKEREKNAEMATIVGHPYPPYNPVWFKKETEPITGNIAHIYQRCYWEAKRKRDWSKCPNIF